MLQYVAITPHSPLLIKTQPQKELPDIYNGFKKIADDLNRLEINHIISIGSHPSFLRASSSVYSSPEFKLQFSDFGDLINITNIAIWWDAFNKLRADNSQIIEIIDDPEIDHSHSIPLFILKKSLSTPRSLKILPINCNENLNLEPLFSSLADENFAVIINGNLFSDDHDNADFNKRIRKDLSEGTLSIKFQEGSDKPCLFDPLMSVLPSIQSDFTYEELAFENTNKLNLLISIFTRPK